MLFMVRKLTFFVNYLYSFMPEWPIPVCKAKQNVPIGFSRLKLFFTNMLIVIWSVTKREQKSCQDNFEISLNVDLNVHRWSMEPHLCVIKEKVRWGRSCSRGWWTSSVIPFNVQNKSKMISWICSVTTQHCPFTLNELRVNNSKKESWKKASTLSDNGESERI